ncbi:MAG TPA: hypothetical protein PKA64_04520 [Myxococcota bacterium]|nr:hypothetical protein [Myxococcota bacterium]
MHRLMVPLALALSPGVALGQESTFALDAVLVTTFDHPSAIPRSRVEPLEGMLRESLAKQHLVVPMGDVPPFESFTADIYMLGCPTGRYAGCALVVGQRADVDWVVGAELRLEGDDILATFSYVDVRASELMFQINAVFDGEDDDVVIQRLGSFLDAMIAGEFTSVDLRDVDGIAHAADDAEFRRRQIEAAGLDLAEMDAELGAVDREETELDRGRRSVREVKADYAEGVAPWARLKLTPFQYVRATNRGIPLATMKSKARGRRGEILVGTGGVFGVGPWGQHWEGWYGLDAADLRVIERAVSLDQQRDVETSWSFEAGAGVLPWLDVMAFGGVRVSGWTWRVQQIVEGDQEPVDDVARKVVTTPFVGGRVDFAPLPAYPARPTLGLGAAWWGGTDQTRVIQVPSQLPTLQRDWMAIVQLAPGVEVDLGRAVHLWARLNVDVPVAGRVLQEDASDGPLLAARPQPTLDDDGVGLAAAVGLTGRIRVLPKR